MGWPQGAQGCHSLGASCKGLHLPMSFVSRIKIIYPGYQQWQLAFVVLQTHLVADQPQCLKHSLLLASPLFSKRMRPLPSCSLSSSELEPPKKRGTSRRPATSQGWREAHSSLWDRVGRQKGPAPRQHLGRLGLREWVQVSDPSRAARYTPGKPLGDNMEIC